MWLQQVRSVGSMSVTSDANSDFDINDVIDSTFDSKYVSNGTSTTFTIRIVANEFSNFVGIAGHNLFAQGVTDITINTELGETMSYTPTSNGVICFRIGVPKNLWIDIVITKPSSNQIILTHVTLGAMYSISRAKRNSGGFEIAEKTTEQGGFLFEELNRHFKSRTTTNTLSAPTSFIRQSYAPKIKLKIPNQWLSYVTDDPTQGAWQEALDFWSSSEGFAWFMIVDDPITYTASERCLLCFDTKPVAPKRQNTNASLVDLSLSCKVYNGKLF